MSFGSRIKERREQLNMSRPELASKIGVTSSAISNYENSISFPKIELMYKLFEALDCDANYLHQDEMTALLYKDKATPEEFESIVKKYRALDQDGQKHILYELDRETQRTQTIKNLSEQADQLRAELSRQKVITRYFSYYGKIAAAGKSFGFDDIIAADVMELPVTDLNRNADYLIGVSGDSMEPDYSDGDIVYVKKTNHLNTGDVGIFQKDNGIYIKEVGENGLISRNKKYKPMVNGGNVICLGKVIGKVAEDE